MAKHSRDTNIISVIIFEFISTKIELQEFYNKQVKKIIIFRFALMPKRFIYDQIVQYNIQHSYFTFWNQLKIPKRDTNKSVNNCNTKTI